MLLWVRATERSPQSALGEAMDLPWIPLAPEKVEEPGGHRRGAAASEPWQGFGDSHSSSAPEHHAAFPSPPMESKTTTKYFELGSYSPSEATGWINSSWSWAFAGKAPNERVGGRAGALAGGEGKLLLHPGRNALGARLWSLARRWLLFSSVLKAWANRLPVKI